MQGWTGFVPPHRDPKDIDEVWTIEDEEAIEMTRQLGPDALVVTLAVDSGFKYMSGEPYASL